jgi:hypothetical protein
MVGSRAHGTRTHRLAGSRDGSQCSPAAMTFRMT